MVEEQFIREARYIAASTTDSVIGSKKGGIIQRIIIVPATTSPGAVSYKDGSGGAVRTIFTGGASSVADLKTIVVELGVRGADVSGFRITTGAAVSVIAIGRFNTV